MDSLSLSDLKFLNYVWITLYCILIILLHDAYM